MWDLGPKYPGGILGKDSREGPSQGVGKSCWPLLAASSPHPRWRRRRAWRPRWSAVLSACSGPGLGGAGLWSQRVPTTASFCPRGLPLWLQGGRKEALPSLSLPGKERPNVGVSGLSWPLLVGSGFCLVPAAPRGVLGDAWQREAGPTLRVSSITSARLCTEMNWDSSAASRPRSSSTRKSARGSSCGGGGGGQRSPATPEETARASGPLAWEPLPAAQGEKGCRHPVQLLDWLCHAPGEPTGQHTGQLPLQP